MKELGAPTQRVLDAPAQVLTFARGGLVPASDTSSASCAGRASGDGLDDVHVAFRAPRAGLWRLRAEGEGLRSLLAVRRCETETGAFCVEQRSRLHGAALRNAIELEVDMQEGETFELALDGCDPSTRCEWAVRAERWDGLRCADASSSAFACGASQRCSADADGRRFVCEDVILADREENLALDRVSASIDRESRALLVDARFAGPVEGSAYLVVDRWILSDETELAPATRILANERIRGGRLTAIVGEIDPRVVGAALWFSTDRATIRRTVRFEPWLRRAVGQPCSDDPIEQCARSAACDEGVCVSAAAPALREARAWSDGRSASIGLRAVGVAVPGESLWARVESRVGAAPWSSASRALVRGSWERAARFVYNNNAVESVAGATEARITLVDASDRTLEQRVLTIARKAVIGVADACSGPDVQCADGLACERDSHGARCRPAIAQRTECRAPAATPWRPLGDRARITGFGYDGDAIDPARACVSGVRARGTPVSFVAPADGHYRFVGRSVAELVATRACEEAACGRGEAGEVTLLEREMRAGEAWIFDVRPVPRAGEFWVEMRLGEAP